MKLPVIKHLISFIEENDEDYLLETIDTLEALTEIPSLKDEELDVLGELISNLYGAVEVNKMIKEGTSKKEALNAFMQRVLGSIDQ
ncbi:MAG: hypothetical protein P8P88_10185 [Polaribacter sp.]|jgi:hypothetical protein|nr:hypothetical protein [Polaribacter sp.]